MTDEDERQEYECLLLEGHDPAEAAKLARAANDSVNSRRLSGPTTGDTRNGHGQRPLISDMTWSFYWEGAKSLTQDGRTPQERDQDCQREALARELLQLAGRRQREALTLIYGLGGEPPMSYREVAERMGLSSPLGVNKARIKGLARIRRLTGISTPP